MTGYAWQRYWCPIAATYYVDDRGYVEDPSASRNPNLKVFGDIASTRALVLLGEPGIGKSRAMQDEETNISAAIAASHGEPLWVDLREYGSEDRLVRTVFEGPEVRRWQEGSHVLHLFLDSLDEALLRIETLAAILLSFLRKWPLNRLFLRIACRTADWPRLLDDGLQSLPALGAVGVFELVGLGRTDIATAATAKGLVPADFLRAIEERGVVPLAVKPVTLELLLGLMVTNGALPPTQSELYLAGCRRMCSESHPGADELDPDERLAIASRIAALLVYCGKAAVWTGPNLGELDESDVPVEELAGGAERSRLGLRPVSERAVNEVLRTGLFSARTSAQRLGFSHHTFAEFLAAHYVRDLSLPQVMSLLIHPGDAEGRVVPQLREPAAWVATLRTSYPLALAREFTDRLLSLVS